MPEYINKRKRPKVESLRRIGTDVTMGKVYIDSEKCAGCKLCALCCAAAALEVADKKARMVEGASFCMSCGDCVAICPENAIELKDFIEFKGFFRYLDRGEPEWPRKF